MGESERRLLAEETQAIAEHNLLGWIVQRVLCATGKWPARSHSRVGNQTSEARRQAEEIGEDELINPVPFSTEPEGMFAQHHAAIVLGLVIVLISLLGRQQVRPHVLQDIADADQHRRPIWIQGVGRARQAVGINDAIVEIHITEAYLMVPDPSRVIKTDNVGISVVQVGKSA